MDSTREYYSENDERAVLGCLLHALLGKADWVTYTMERVTVDDFYFPKHQTIFLTIQEMYESGEEINTLTVASRLTESKQIATAGGYVYLSDMAANVPLPSNPYSYIRVVLTHTSRRRVVTQITRLLHALPTAENPEDVAALVDEYVISDAKQTHSEDDTSPLDEAIIGALESADPQSAAQGVSPIMSGLASIDSIVGGFHPGQLAIVGGRPSMGKSLLCFDIARNAVKQGKRVLFISLEMSKKELAQRAAAAEFSIPLDTIINRELSETQWQQVASQLGKVLETSKNLIIAYPNAQDVSHISALVRSLARSGTLDMVVVDYLQLMLPSTKSESRQQEVAKLSIFLKRVARSNNLVVLAASQLNRQSENRAGGRPQLSDLRDSGSLEQDGDVVMLVNRPGGSDETVDPGEAEILVAKNRNGRTGVARVYMDLPYTRVRDVR
jgi:replicative DNA helicase